MKVIFTDEATQSLDRILAFITSNYPTILAAFETRFRTVVSRIGAWPESAQEVAQRRGVRVAPLTPFPYKVFYRITPGAVEILMIQHASRQDPWEGE
jgi:plasmid stabilization system protein ParE